MDEPAADWIEFTMPDGRKSRLRADNIGMVTRSSVACSGGGGIVCSSSCPAARPITIGISSTRSPTSTGPT
jgi:hypothetical protein